jgi:hypothetical protein
MLKDFFVKLHVHKIYVHILSDSGPHVGWFPTHPLPTPFHPLPPTPHPQEGQDNPKSLRKNSPRNTKGTLRNSPPQPPLGHAAPPRGGGFGGRGALGSVLCGKVHDAG